MHSGKSISAENNTETPMDRDDLSGVILFLISLTILGNQKIIE